MADGEDDQAMQPSIGPAGRLLRTVQDIYALARGSEAIAPLTDVQAGAPHEADLIEARLIADQWRNRAEDAERRVAELEARVAASEMVALELRSRVVCLHGKLATANDTVRYQSLTLALDGAPPASQPPLD